FERGSHGRKKLYAELHGLPDRLLPDRNHRSARKRSPNRSVATSDIRLFSDASLELSRAEKSLSPRNWTARLLRERTFLSSHLDVFVRHCQLVSNVGLMSTNRTGVSNEHVTANFSAGVFSRLHARRFIDVIAGG